jgi:predicted solute-binding protein
LAATFSAFRKQLSQSVEAFRKDPESALAHWMQHYPTQLSLDFLKQYFQIVEYGFSDLHKKSLQLFLQLSAEEGLIASAPPLRFL